jgi:predicted site-specific integrase-resolvase
MALNQLVRSSRIQLMLDVSAWTLNRWIREEGFPVIHIEGAGRRFDPVKVQEWLDKRSKARGTEPETKEIA